MVFPPTEADSESRGHLLPGKSIEQGQMNIARLQDSPEPLPAVDDGFCPLKNDFEN